MSEDVTWVGDEGVAAVLGLVLVKNGGDVRIPEFMVAEGLPNDSRVAVYWDNTDLVIGIRKNGWEPEDADG